MKNFNKSNFWSSIKTRKKKKKEKKKGTL